MPAAVGTRRRFHPDDLHLALQARRQQLVGDQGARVDDAAALASPQYRDVVRWLGQLADGLLFLEKCAPAGPEAFRERFQGRERGVCDTALDLTHEAG